MKKPMSAGQKYRKADSMGAGRKEKAKALLDVSRKFAEKAKTEAPAPFQLGAIPKPTSSSKSNEAFGKAVTLALELRKIKKEGANMARTQGKPSATSGASRSVAGKVKPNPNKSKATYLKGKK